MLIIPATALISTLLRFFQQLDRGPSLIPVVNQCGSCSRCLDACPKGAIDEGFFCGCIPVSSYWTIESKATGSILGGEMGHCFFRL